MREGGRERRRGKLSANSVPGGQSRGIDEREGEEERRVSAVSMSVRWKADDTSDACQSEDLSQHRTVYKIC